MKTNVSVIMPVYNAEKYLRCSIDSILRQNYTYFELILVDDGSKDSSGEICDSYAAADSRVRVFHKKNDGQSSAKNYGLERAGGTFVIFINADDFWTTPDALGHLTETAEKYQADIVKGEYVFVDEDGNTIAASKRHKCVSGRIISRHRLLKDGFAGELSLFLALIRKDALNGLLFDESFSFDEDPELLARLFCRKLKCTYTPEVFYGYRIHPETIRAAHRLSSLQCSFALAGTFARCSSELSGQLKRYYRHASVNAYYRGLRMMSNDAYRERRKTIIQVLRLNELQKKTRGRIFKWLIFDRHFFACIVPPAPGLSFISRRNRMEDAVYKDRRQLSETIYFNKKGNGKFLR